MQIVVGAVVRHVLTMVGGGLIVNGSVTGDEMTQVIGAVTTVIVIGISVFQKWQKKQMDEGK
ncbi:MAG: hypothetical protein A3E01_06075 [Gammaproteobacteria bacterium RIFCSPHIGHO2_12_FULL_63_22]|nr:MAG: hypothetical protein A3E01_06075 [Gammaproteobacteria bacterium RIFCSPHIGHO2_12_FULL_63_22]